MHGWTGWQARLRGNMFLDTLRKELVLSCCGITRHTSSDARAPSPHARRAATHVLPLASQTLLQAAKAPKAGLDLVGLLVALQLGCATSQPSGKGECVMM